MRSLKELSPRDIEEDPNWLFQPNGIAVLSNLERIHINVKSVLSFAKHHELPVIRWKKPIDARRA